VHNSLNVKDSPVTLDIAFAGYFFGV